MAYFANTRNTKTCVTARALYDVTMAIPPVKFLDKEVGEGKPVFVICEGGVTHYGEMAIAKQQIDAAVAARADVVKFQAWRTEDLISRPIAKRLEPELGYDWFERIKYKEFSLDQLRELQAYAAQRGIAWLATPHDEWGLDILDKELGMSAFKIGSGESHNFDFLEKVGKHGKPVIISFGLQTDEEAVRAVKTLQDAGAAGVVALHCVTAYPMPYEMVGLPRLAHLKELLGVPVGISDHSIGRHVPLGAVALGAVAVEKHITFDKDDPRSLDNPGALLPEEFIALVKEIRDLEKAMRNIAEDERMTFLRKSRDWAGQSIVASRDIPAGATLTREMIAFKRPARGGLEPADATKIIDKKTNKVIPIDEQIHLEDMG